MSTVRLFDNPHFVRVADHEKAREIHALFAASSIYDPPPYEPQPVPRVGVLRPTRGPDEERQYEFDNGIYVTIRRGPGTYGNRNGEGLWEAAVRAPPRADYMGWLTEEHVELLLQRAAGWEKGRLWTMPIDILPEHTFVG